MKRHAGFTLMEMLIVLATLAILLSLAVPALPPTAIRNNVNESIKLVEPFKDNINLYYNKHGEFPSDNSTAGMPEQDKIIGNFITNTEQSDGALHLTFGNKIQPLLMDKVLTLRAVYVEGSPQSPISWICGYDPIPKGMTAAGENRTNIDNIYLPKACRK